MEGGVVAEVVLPLAIFLIMVSLGMALVVDDFRRVLAAPKQVGVGLLCQLVLLPLLGFAVAAAFPLEPVFAVSIVLLAASPGGTMSNLVAHAADIDRALSVTLTALSSAVVWLTMPFLLGLGFRAFADTGVDVGFPVGEVMVQIAALTIVPVLIGMAVRNRWPDWAIRTADRSKIAAGAFLGVVIVVLIIQEWELATTQGPRFAPAFMTLNAAALAVGYGVARLARIAWDQALTISVETGLQNATLSIAIAISVLGDPQLAIIPGLYGVWMLATGFAFAIWLARRQDTTERPRASTPV